MTLLYFAVENLPQKMYGGVKVLALPSLDEAMLIHNGNIYKLLCKESSCNWKKMRLFVDGISSPVVMFVDSFYCRNQ